MTTLEIADPATRDDLRQFLQRADRVGEPQVRLLQRGSAATVFVCTQAPAGLLDPVPVVLGARGFRVHPGPDADGDTDALDVTVEIRALLDRFARLGPLGRVLELPPNESHAAWTGVLPPRDGWQPTGRIDATSLQTVARDGIARVAAALPSDAGDAVVRTVRRGVWGSNIAPDVPAAAAFAAETLGFIDPSQPVRLSRTLTWVRLATDRGNVLVRRQRG